MPENEKKASTTSSFSKDVLLEENIKREVKYYRISDQFTFTPKMQKNMVIAKKPTGERGITHVMKIDDPTDISHAYSDLVDGKAQKIRYPYPMTTSQDIGWDTTTLVNIYGSRFNHPKVKTDVTKFYLGSENKKEPKEKK